MYGVPTPFCGLPLLSSCGTDLSGLLLESAGFLNGARIVIPNLQEHRNEVLFARKLKGRGRIRKVTSYSPTLSREQDL